MVVKCDFRIKTLNGLVLEHIVIQAASREDAERRLHQMYHHCQILATRVDGRDEPQPGQQDHQDLEHILTLIAKTRH